MNRIKRAFIFAITTLFVFGMPAAVAEKPKPVSIEESVELNVKVEGVPTVVIDNIAPVPVVVEQLPYGEVVHFYFSCASPCYAGGIELGYVVPEDKTLEITDAVFSNRGPSDGNTLRASIAVNPIDVEPILKMFVLVPPGDTRSVSLNTGIVFNPMDNIEFNLNEGANSGVGIVTGKLKDL